MFHGWTRLKKMLLAYTIYFFILQKNNEKFIQIQVYRLIDVTNAVDNKTVVHVFSSVKHIELTFLLDGF